MEHKDIPDAQLHEVKGAVSATAGQILTATGSGTSAFVTPTFSTVAMGWYDYNDTATTGTPIALTLANTFYDLTNNGAGTNTKIIYGISGVPNIWNTATNRFDFSGLSLGDTIEIRADVDVTTTVANTVVDMYLELATGTGTPVNLPLLNPVNVKVASTIKLLSDRGFYLGTDLTRLNPAKIKMRADSTGTTVKVNGWYVRVIKR